MLFGEIKQGIVSHPVDLFKVSLLIKALFQEAMEHSFCFGMFTLFHSCDELGAKIVFPVEFTVSSLLCIG